MLNEEVIVEDRARRVPVANVPREPGQIALYSEKGFLRGSHADGTAIFKDERLAGLDMGGVRQVNEKGRTRCGHKPFAANETRGVIEDDFARVRAVW